jgi:hypothetical protein
MKDQMEEELSASALMQAMTKEKSPEGLIHHFWSR